MALLERPETTLSGELRYVPDGPAGIAATLDAMVEMTRHYKTDLTVRRLAEQIVSTVPDRNWYGESQAVQEWVRGNIRYTQDVYDVETLKTPLALINNPFGDCDDMALLAGTLLQSLGHPVRYVAMGTDGVNFEHVYVETKIGTRWVGIETTEDVHVGWVPPVQSPRMVRHV